MISRYVGLAVGVWYLLAPFVWRYPSGFLWWHSIVIGAIVIAVSASYLVGWNRLGAWVLIAVGAYSMVSPFLYDYIKQPFPFFHDLAFGVITIGVGAALGAAAMEYGGDERKAEAV